MTDVFEQARKMTWSHVSRDTATVLPGRRDYSEYRDMGLAAASGGWMRAQIISSKERPTQQTGMRPTPPTGWHYHLCHAQIVYILKGFADLEFENGKRVRAKEGDMVFIPGGLKHNDISASADIEVIEMSLPAEMGTVACDPPEGWTDTSASVTEQATTTAVQK